MRTSATFLWVFVLELCCWRGTTGVVTSCPVAERSEWGAKPPANAPVNMTLPVPYVVIHHSYIPSACGTREACLKAMKSMQYMHQTDKRWNDIGYNFAIGSDGQVYEGRGWDLVGAHAPKYNFMSIGICFIGDYRTEAPPAPMLEAAQRLILCGINRGSIDTNYTLVGHRQVRETECPGGALFEVIQQWLHWKPIRDIQPRVRQDSKPPPNDSTDQPARDTTGKPALPETTDQSAWDTDSKPAHALTTDQSARDTNSKTAQALTTDQSILGDSVTNLPKSTQNYQSELDIGNKSSLSSNTTNESPENMKNRLSPRAKNRAVTPPPIPTTSSRDPPFLDDTDTISAINVENETSIAHITKNTVIQ